jgi:hypothetical protein
VLIPPVTLPPQLWVDMAGSGQTPQETADVAIFDDEHGLPGGGLWTSTYEDGSSPYLRTVLGLNAGFLSTAPRPAWRLTPREAKVYVAEDGNALLDLAALAPGAGTGVWSQVEVFAEAVHMTAAGARAFLRTPVPEEPNFKERIAVLIRLRRDGEINPFDLWEAERTIWFRWCFEGVERVADVDVPLIEPAAVG